MMSRKLTTAVACAVAATTVGVGALSSSASAAQVEKSGFACVKAGVSTLISLGLLDDALRREIDYSTLADPVDGPIFTDLPEGSFLSLTKVIKLHVTNPELFAWCR